MIEHVLMIAFLSLGIHSITREGMIFGFWEHLCKKENEQLKSVLLNTISECYCCMVSFWGIVYFWLAGSIDNLTTAYFVCSVLALVNIDSICEIPRFSKINYLFLFACAVIYSANPLGVLLSIICAGGFNYAVSRIE